MGLKIIFLDIDGVLITLESARTKVVEAKADPRAVKALNHLVKRSGARIVISSTWRALGLARMEEYLMLWGVEARIFGLTPDPSDLYRGLFLSVSRTEEINRWLRDCPEPIESFVILDDDPIEEPLNRHHVQTNFEDGLTQWHIDEALRILGEREWLRG